MTFQQRIGRAVLIGFVPLMLALAATALANATDSCFWLQSKVCALGHAVLTACCNAGAAGLWAPRWIAALLTGTLGGLATAGAVMALTSRRPFRNFMGGAYVVAVLLTLCAWLVPHCIVKLYGTRLPPTVADDAVVGLDGVALMGDGTLLIGFSTNLDENEDRARWRPYIPGRRSSMHRIDAWYAALPGVDYFFSVGPDIGGPLLTRPDVKEHRLMVRLWVPLILLVFCGLVVMLFRRSGGKLIACECGYNLTHVAGPTCPFCGKRKPNAT
jgi:hypothetical protein